MKISCLIAIALTLPPVIAQKYEFEVASVKKADSGVPPGDIARNMAGSPGHFSMRNVPLRYILEWAYDLKDYEILGPEWIIGDERYDIIATALGATGDKMRAMLQTLVDQRFQMKSHWEIKEMSVYALTRGKGAPKLKPSEGDPSLGGLNGTPMFRNQPVSRFTFMLTRRMDRPVLDETGLKGTYDFSLDLSGLGFNGRMAQDPNAPSIFSTVQSDLGLKLEATKRPVKILVVDSANKTPVEN
jgi:uncharacterized protein (TIGR03435 family)